MDLKSKDGWLEVVCGCMFAGKTEELIRQGYAIVVCVDVRCATRNGDVKNKKSIVAPEINICSIFLIIVRIVTTWLFGQMKLKSKWKKKL